MSELLEKSIKELSSGLRSGEFSAVELTQSFLKQLEESSSLNAFTSTDTETSIRHAGAADELIAKKKGSALCGIPVALKDLIVTTDFDTTCASKILTGYRSPFEATCSQQLRSAGAVVLGKTNMDEFAMGSSNENSCFGPVKNPWDEKRVPGGSSGGSAVAVAARMTPYSLGSDTGGSIRQPASFCGISGLKPTYGRVSRYGVVAFASSLDQIGPFAKSVEDLAIVSETLFGHDARDSTSVDRDVPAYSTELSSDISGKRIGIPKEYFSDALDTEVRSAVELAINELESLGAKTVEISLPNTDSAIATYYIIAPAEASSNLARFDGVRYGYREKEAEDLIDMYARSRSAGFGPEVRRRIFIGNYVLSQGYYDAYYRKAQRVRALIASEFKEVFAESCDLIACPTTPTTAFMLGEKTSDPLQMYLNDIYTVPVNLAGLPGLSIPCGFDENSLPIGLQLIGNAWDEQSLLNVGYAYQQQTDWHLRTPTLQGGA